MINIVAQLYLKQPEAGRQEGARHLQNDFVSLGLGNMRRKKISFNLVLNQNEGFDVLAAISKGLTRRRVRHRFIYPHPRGPLQGPASDARKFLSLYDIDQNLFLDLGSFIGRLFGALILKSSSANIVQTPVLNEHFHPKFLKMLLRSGNASYANYGLNLSDKAEYHYNLESYSRFTNVLVSSQIDRDGLIKAGIMASKIIQIGNPLVFELSFELEKTYAVGGPMDSIKILWAPHWSSTWSNWEQTLPTFLNLLNSSPEISVTFRPHPLLLSGLRNELPEGYGFAAPSEPERLVQLHAFLEHDRVELSSSSLVDDCCRNDILVTDGVSIIGFWATTGKPLAVLRRQDSPPFGPQIKFFESSLEEISPSSGSLIYWIIRNINELRKSKKISRSFPSPYLVYESGDPIDPTTLLLRVFQ